MRLVKKKISKPLKIIHLSGFAKDKTQLPFTIENDYFFVASWAGLIARRLKAFDKNLDIEVWRAEDIVSKKRTKQVFNIFATLYPYKYPIIKNLVTFEMFKSILSLRKSFKIILHYHSVFDRFVLLKYFLPKDVQIVLSHHGGIPPKTGSFKDLIIKRTYKRVSAITYLSNRTKTYLENIGYDKNKMFFLPVGADFEKMIPVDKQKAREMLGLEKDKVYGIYVGKFYKLKSVDLILQVYYALKDKYNFSVIFVGGSDDSENDLYKEVRNSGCPYFGIQDWNRMNIFYSAADFYLHPAFNPKFGGLDVSWIEALACNKPVLSPQLAYLDFDYSELGVLLKDWNETIEKTEWMINNYKTFTKCREVAQKYLDGNSAIMKKLITIYEEI